MRSVSGFCVAGMALLAAGLPSAVGQQSTPSVDAQVQAVSARFWAWRATEQPLTDDDIPRLERPPRFSARWSAKEVAGYEARIGDLEREWRGVDVTGAPVATQVDWRLVGSAIARVRWELDVLPVWRRSPEFYVQQGLGAAYQAMLPPAPFSDARREDVLLRLESVPRLLDEGRANLTDMRRPYAVVAMGDLEGIEAHMQAFREGVDRTGVMGEEAGRFDRAEEVAAKALVAYREWLRPQVAGMKAETAVGREGYEYFLRNVALMRETPEDMLAVGEHEFARAVAFETLQRAANTGLPETPIYPSLEAQIAEEVKQERIIRSYMISHGILSEPAGVKHYLYRAMPPYIAALSFLGVTDDLTSESRLGENGTSYKSTPREGMPFFDAITARDVRPLMIHEGVPGHYYQMTWSWHNPDPIRRHHYDSESNEGIGFYGEEMMLEAGLFDRTPKTKEAIDSMMRLRALRVVVDVKLALGEFTLAQAAAYLEKTVPMDKATAGDEAASFATGPGQAITYQMGKSDLIQMMTEAREKEGAGFRLQRFQDFVWKNGNVPFSLQKWELLGDKSGVPAVPETFGQEVGTR